MSTEKPAQTSYINLVNSKYWETVPELAHAFKLKAESRVGYPDTQTLVSSELLTYSALGRPSTFFIEFKDVGKDAEPIQAYIGKKLSNLGFGWYVCCTLDEALEVFYEETGVYLL